MGIAMEVEGYGSFEFEDIRHTADSLSFVWTPSFELDCSMYLLEDGVYQGACMDPWGGFGGIVMAPPGSNVDAIKLHNATIESIAGWSAPPMEEAQPSLGETYPQGRMVSVSGRTVNLVDVGASDVTVILEAALGDNLTSWERLHKLLAQTLRVVAYDRAGMGLSEASASERGPEQIAVDLHGLLREAEIPPPYILVGHAEGALIVRRFAALYEEEVTGMVLIDPHHETQAEAWRALSAGAWDEFWTQKKEFHQRMPHALRAEFEAYAKIIDQGSVPGLGPLPDMPTVVLTAGRPSEAPLWIGDSIKGREAWRRFHQTWIGEATHITASHVGAYIHQEDPDLVLQAILQVAE